MTDKADARPALPPGWAWATLGEITLPQRPKLRADRDSDLPFLGMDSIKPGSLKPSKVSRFGEMRSAATCFEPGDVLYGRLRPYLNKVWHADCSGAASAEFIVFPANPYIDSDFLKFMLHHSRFVHFASHLVSGDRPRVDRDQIADYELAVPPLAEQRRIVARIDELFGEVEAGEQELEKAREGLADFRRAVLKAAVTGELTREWREKNPSNETGADLLTRILAERRAACERAELARLEAKGKTPKDAWKANYVEPAPLDTSDLPELPQGWVWCSMEQVGEILLGRQRAPQHHNGEHMRPYLRVANVLDDELDLSDVKRMNFTPEEFQTFCLKPGDILLNEGQSPDLVGRPAIYRGEIEGCCFQKTLIRFRAGPTVIPEYAQLVFRHYMYSGRFRRAARITTNIGHLTLIRFIPMEFPLPPLREQSEIVEKASDQVLAAKELSAISEQSDRLRQSILTAAFSGKLVPQDPADEPASVLLERLRTAKAAMPARRSSRSVKSDAAKAPLRLRNRSRRTSKPAEEILS